MKKDIAIITILFIAIIGLTLWFSSSPAYVPYSSTIAMGPAKYEGFSSLEYSNATDHSAMDGSIMNYAIDGNKSGCKSVSGYNGFGVFCDPAGSPEKIDIFSEAKGSLTGDSYGYYNSQGPIQFDDNMKKQLSTRGMNASGSPSSLGGSAV